MKTILVSGASGFLGKKLIPQLSINFRVLALYRTDIPDSLRHMHNIEWIRIDLTNPKDFLGIPHEIDLVIHLAGATLGAGSDPFNYFESNERATFNLLKEFSGDCRRFIYASSQVVYGDPCSLDVAEEQPLDPVESAYACSKINCENWLRYFQEKTNGIYLSLRFCGFIDGGGLVDYILDMACLGRDIELFDSGAVVRDYIPSYDAISALSSAVSCIEKLEPGFIPINIGSGQLISSTKIAKLICDVTKSDSRIIKLDKKGPQRDFILSNKKARRILKFEPCNLIDAITRYATK